jgi:hypothetical protein
MKTENETEKRSRERRERQREYINTYTERVTKDIIISLWLPCFKL